MSTPDPVPPPPPNNAKKWLIGCLVAVLLLAALGVAVLMLGIYAAKKQVDSMSADASKVVEDARRAAKALESSSQVAPALAQAAEANMRLTRAANTVDESLDPQAEPCMPDTSRNSVAVDGPWLAELANGLPSAAVGTPWFREKPFADAAAVGLDANATEEQKAQALVALDRALGEAGAVAVVHAQRMEENENGGQFEGFIQLIGYPDGATMCTAPFAASGTNAEEFHSHFWTAKGAVLGK
jgi:hypothetical protein